MYPTSGAVIRGDLNAVVEEAQAGDRFHIADAIMPPIPVSLKSGTYPKIQIGEGQLLSALDTTRQGDGSYNEVVRGYTSDTYDCIDRGLEERVDDSDMKDLARFFNVESAAARLTRRNVALAREVRVAAAIMNATTFGAGTAAAVDYTEALIATINFPLDVKAACRRIKANGAVANTIVMSGAVFDRVSRATLTTNYVRGSLLGQTDTPINAQNLAAAFADDGIEQVLVGQAAQNTANKKQTASTSEIWGVTYVWVGYVNMSARAVQDGGSGFTFYWSEDSGLYTTETYRDEKRRSNMVRVRNHVTEKVADATAGTLITTSYA